MRQERDLGLATERKCDKGCSPMATCNDRRRTHQRLGLGPVGLAPCPNAPGDRVVCTHAPNLVFPPSHNPGARTVCNTCWTNADIGRSPLESANLDSVTMTRNTGPGAKFTSNVNGCRGLLCQHCEADELELYKRNIALGLAPPLAANKGWEDTCTCRESRVRLHAGVAGALAHGARYCLDCRDREVQEIRRLCGNTMAERIACARDSHHPPRAVTAHPNLQQWRLTHGRWVACRCGRDTVEATLHQRATYCLCCSGVQIDIQHPGNRVTRHNAANIVARAATPAGLPALRFTAIDFNITARGTRNILIQVVRCNNRR
ncbi:hypothetical protein LTR53_004097 [Teratosphaeriaceae sp. CCFEE 6253]|nr:hypothetical protein LTR53_004097 [Teratosphaeriaceae sp. CCFEE 6253]